VKSSERDEGVTQAYQTVCHCSYMVSLRGRERGESNDIKRQPTNPLWVRAKISTAIKPSFVPISHPAVRPENYKVNSHVMYILLFLIMSIVFLSKGILYSQKSLTVCRQQKIDSYL